MRNQVNNKDLTIVLRAHIKAGLQVCHNTLNKSKHPEMEYRLFNSLAELYIIKEEAREYPKVAAIYQYLKKLVEKYLNGDKEKLALVDQRIKVVETRFLEKLKVHKPDIKNREQEVTEIGSYKEELVSFREGIKKELAVIEDLGIEKDKEELNEEGLQKRAQEVEKIYMEIREFFIGKRNEAQKLIKAGLVNRLIGDCINQLGGLPRVGRDNRECTYAVFGMGSMALGTMTPWSDLEFGILIGEGLTKDEEKGVKEYLRLLTTLLHIKVINFGETPLRMMGVEELNNFKLTEISDSEHNWFYDSLINSGFSFDGPHSHACKTPLGRKRYREHEDYELIDTSTNILRLQGDKWHRNNSQLSQGLINIIIIEGNNILIENYREFLREKINTNIVAFQQRNLDILKDDADKYDPRRLLYDSTEIRGKLLNIKKDIYRFLDRTLVALIGAFGTVYESNWDIIKEFSDKKLGGLDKESTFGLTIALCIAAELRLKIYSNNKGQVEMFSALSYSSIAVSMQDKVRDHFHLQHIKLLEIYYVITTRLMLKLRKIFLQNLNYINIREVVQNINLSNIYKLPKHSSEATDEDIAHEAYVYGLVNLQFLNYLKVVEYFERYKKLTIKLLGSEQHIDIAFSLNILGMAYDNLRNYEQAQLCYEQALEMYKEHSKHLDIASLHINLGTNYSSLGKYDDAIKHLEQALTSFPQMTNLPKLAIAYYNLGACYFRKGKNEIAIYYLEIALSMFGLQEADIADTFDVLGTVYLSKNGEENLNKAEKYLNKALDIKLKIYGSIHPYVATTYHNLGELYRLKGNVEKAKECLDKAFSIKLRVYGEHPRTVDTLHSLLQLDNNFLLLGHRLLVQNKIHDTQSSREGTNNKGMNETSLKMYEEALEYHQKSLKLEHGIHQGDHPIIAYHLHYMGITLGGLGKHEEALKYFQESLEMRQRTYKEDHIDIASSLNDTGVILRKLGRYEEALQYKQESLEMIRRIYKGDHKNITDSLVNIGNDLYNLGRYKEALQYRQESLKTRCRLYKEDHIDIARSLNDTGVTLHHLSRYDEALKYHQESLEMRRRIYKEDHIDIARSLNDTGVTLHHLSRYDEALKYHQESLEMGRRIYKEDHTDIAAFLNNMGNVLKSLNSYEEALQYHQKSLRMKRRLYKEDHTDIAGSLNNIGTILEKLGRFEEALKYHQEGLEMRRRIYKGDHADIIHSLNNIGSTLERLSRLEEVLQHQHESLEMSGRIYKKDPIHIAISMNNIGITLRSLGRYEEALQLTLQSINIFKKVLPFKHPIITNAQKQFLTCTVLLANQEIVLGNFDKVLAYYARIGENIKVGEIEKITYAFANRYWQAGEVTITISCYEALSEKLMLQDRDIKHNLACAYHVKALKEKNKGRIEDCKKYLSKSKETFDKALNLETNEVIKASLYAEYAMFLLMYHDLRNAQEYSVITANAKLAISLKEDGSELSYSQIDKSTTMESLQELLNRQQDITVKPYLLAYCLLVKVQYIHNNEEQSKETLEGLIEEVQLLQGAEDEEMAQYLLDWCYRELESQKLQQVVILQLTDLLRSSMYAMAERRNITTIALSQSLPHNHIGIIWDYYSEHRIMSVLKHELRQMFNSILSSSSEILRAALSQNDKHVDIVMSYLDEEIVLSENFETGVITARKENKAVMKELSMST